jgi:GTP-binding protein YchF
MSLVCGIVGLPNAGKSTLFNALLKKQVADNSNYPFCTIEPNIGVVEVPDGRLPVLAKIVKTEKIVPAAVEFIDIAGLVKGAHQGEGLGNKFLSHIREVSVICHVVRFFSDDNVAHVEERINPADDVEIINSELILADLQTLEKQKQPKGKVEKDDQYLWQAVEKLKSGLNQGQLAREVDLTDEEKKASQQLCLITQKPVIYVANVDEGNLGEDLKAFTFKPVIKLCAQMESEIASLEEADQKEYLDSLDLKKPGLDRLIKLAYDTLNLTSFLTAGVKEVRAWTIKKGTPARIAAGVIHTDFTDKFIKADVCSFEDFVEYGGWTAVRSAGRVRTEGKDYIIKDGDVVEFKIGV